LIKITFNSQILGTNRVADYMISHGYFDSRFWRSIRLSRTRDCLSFANSNSLNSMRFPIFNNVNALIIRFLLSIFERKE
jgi:hypothetical protein